MVSDTLIAIVRCPDCSGPIARTGSAIGCRGCGRRFDDAGGVLDLRPREAFGEQTKYLDESLHADARHERIGPPLFGAKIRQDMLRALLAPGPDDRVLDLGCGSGRTLAWNADSGAWLAGVDIAPYFAAAARERGELLLGDLRRLPIQDAAFTKAWTLDVLEHLSPEALRDVLSEARRVLTDHGALFVYTHVRENGWPAAGVRLANRIARLCERLGLLDLRLERLRKSDHLNPIGSHDELARLVSASGFRLERVTYYSPVVGAFVENVLVRIAERWLGRRSRRAGGAAPAGDSDAMRAGRAAAQDLVGRRGFAYRAALALSAVMKVDIWLFGRIRSGPFFALLRKLPDRRAAQA
jgi:SAM-dependent methyltransferase